MQWLAQLVQLYALENLFSCTSNLKVSIILQKYIRVGGESEIEMEGGKWKIALAFACTHHYTH